MTLAPLTAKQSKRKVKDDWKQVCTDEATEAAVAKWEFKRDFG